MRDALTALLHVAAICQTLFVILWATLPWWREWIGRALMVKSLSLMVYLDWALAYHYWPHMPAVRVIGAVLFGFITLGIVSQLAALIYEMWRGSRHPAPQP